jgi:hypothetical protein
MRHSNLARRPNAKVETESFALEGGLNLVDAPLMIPPGMCLAASNYELLTRDGYRRVDGYERFDGQDKPSAASYWILNYDAGTAAISEGDTVTGGTSGHTGVALIDQVGTVSAGYLVLTNVTGTFTDGEDLEVSAAKKCEADGTAAERGAPTAALDSTYAQDAIETQRALIGKVGAGDGSGVVRGVHVYMGDTYAFRDNGAASACLMWKATSSGWVQQSLGNRVAFSAGTAEVFEGETLTQTGTTSTINRVVVQSGTWGGSDAAGYLVIGTVTSGPYVAATIATTPSGSLTTDGAEVANALAAGGRYEFENYNFFGATETKRMYGVNGVSEAFEWDGTVFVPILTGNTTDTPYHLAINEYHLMLDFGNGSLQNSDTGTPYVWAGGGAAEIGLGDDITTLIKEVGEALIIVCRNRTFSLLGKNTADSPWDLRIVDEEAGGIEWTAKRLGETRYLDDRGFVTLRAVQAYGDFNTATYSQVIEPLVTSKKTDVISSIIVKKKTQMRTFFSDGTGIIATFRDRKLSGFTALSYKNASGTAIPVNCTANGEDANGKEILFFGSTDGFVYQMDSGTSFDGSPVEASFVLVYNNLGSPSYDKQFKKVVLEVDGAAGTTISYNAAYDYASGRSPVGITLQDVLTSGGSFWDISNWNQFTWAQDDVTQLEGNIDGVARNIALQISSSSTYREPHTLYAVTYHYIFRRLVR